MAEGTETTQSKPWWEKLGYESIQDLGAKIDNEGGIGYWMLNYHNADNFVGTPLEAAARELDKAWEMLDDEGAFDDVEC